MMKKKLVGAREERTALYVLRVQLLGLHLLRDGKKNIGIRVLYVSSNMCEKMSLPGVHKIDKRVKKMMERERERLR